MIRKRHTTHILPKLAKHCLANSKTVGPKIFAEIILNFGCSYHKIASQPLMGSSLSNFIHGNEWNFAS